MVLGRYGGYTRFLKEGNKKVKRVYITKMESKCPYCNEITFFKESDILYKQLTGQVEVKSTCSHYVNHF